jgi:ATP-binding cassette subfamily B protein
MRETVDEMKRVLRKTGYSLLWFHDCWTLLFRVAVYIGAVLLAAFRTLVSKSMLVGDCFVIINSISNISSDIDYAAEVIVKVDEHSRYIDHLREFLNYEIKIPEDEQAPNAPKPEVLTLKGVGFSYEDSERYALQNVDLTVCKGERIAIVGHNGAGKSTLIKLLLRLYDPTEGEILLNGQPIRQLRLSSYRALSGCVFQDYQLFGVTVAENVLLDDCQSVEDRAAVNDAIEKSGMSNKISELPAGIDSIVTREFDKDGAVFSGGQAQKLSIARIFARDCEIVILDEPTSALDPIAEQDMYRRMFAACEGKTVIFISHRLSSATMADRIYLFENGSVTETGSHGELLAKNGTYADMWYKQAKAYEEEKNGEEASK